MAYYITTSLGRDGTVLFIGQVSTVVVSITDPSCWNAASVVSTLELVCVACYTVTSTTAHLQRCCTNKRQKQWKFTVIISI